MFMDTPEDERTKLISCLGAFRQFWGTLPQVWHKKVDPRWRWIGHTFVFWWHYISLQESHEQCVQWIVRFIHSQHSPKRIAFLYDCLAMAVETSLLPPRYTTLINTYSCFSSVSCMQKPTCLFHCVSVKDRVRSAHRLWKFGVGEDSAVGSDLQTDSEDYRRGRLQGLSLRRTHIGHSSLNNFKIIHPF